MYAVVQIVVAILFMGTIKLGVNQLVMHLDFKRTVSKIRLNTEMKKARYHAYGMYDFRSLYTVNTSETPLFRYLF